MTTRVDLSQPFTPAEENAVAHLAAGLTYRQIAESMNISYRTARNHIQNAAKKIPGDLPVQLRVVAWYRGGDVWILPPKN